MKTTNEIKKLARESEDTYDCIESFRGVNGFSVGYIYRLGFENGYTQAQQDMMEDVANAPLVAKEFEEWFLHYPLWRVAMSRQESCEIAFTAGRLSGLKQREERINELERANDWLRNNQDFLRNELDWSDKTRKAYRERLIEIGFEVVVDQIDLKIKQLEQGE